MEYSTHAELDDQSIKVSILFIPNAISLLKRLAEVLEIHSMFRDAIQNKELFITKELDRFFEQRLATYIKDKIRTYIITEDDVINGINILIKDVFHKSYDTFPSEKGHDNMLNSYPITLLSKVCNVRRTDAHIIGESVRGFVGIRRDHKKWLPPELINIIQGYIPLTGHSNSPLTVDELEALHRYLGSKKNIYVHMLLNSLFEISQDIKVLNQDRLTENNILTICKSSWVYLVLLAASQSIFWFDSVKSDLTEISSTIENIESNRMNNNDNMDLEIIIDP